MDWALEQFARNPATATKRYRVFMEEGLGEGRRKDFHQGSFEGRALGDDAFIDHVLLQAEEVRAVSINLDQIIESVCAVYQLTVEELCKAGKVQPPAEARALAALLVRNCETLSLVGLGELLMRDLSGLSQAARRIERRIGTDSLLAMKLEKVSRSLKISDCQA